MPDDLLEERVKQVIEYEDSVIKNIRICETCRSAKAEDLLLKDLTTVPTQGLYSNQ